MPEWGFFRGIGFVTKKPPLLINIRLTDLKDCDLDGEPFIQPNTEPLYRSFLSEPFISERMRLIEQIHLSIPSNTENQILN